MRKQSGKSTINERDKGAPSRRVKRANTENESHTSSDEDYVDLEGYARNIRDREELSKALMEMEEILNAREPATVHIYLREEESDTLFPKIISRENSLQDIVERENLRKIKNEAIAQTVQKAAALYQGGKGKKNHHAKNTAATAEARTFISYSRRAVLQLVIFCMISLLFFIRQNKVDPEQKAQLLDEFMRLPELINEKTKEILKADAASDKHTVKLDGEDDTPAVKRRKARYKRD